MVLQLPGLLTNPLFKHSKAAEDGFSRYRDFIANKHKLLFAASGMIVSGVASHGNYNGWDIALFADGADGSAGFGGQWPEDLVGTTITLTLRWIPKTTGTAYIIVAVRNADVGEDYLTLVYNPPKLLVVATANQIHEQIFILENQGFSAGDSFNIRVSRWGGVGSDTLAGDICLISAELKYE